MDKNKIALIVSLSLMAACAPGEPEEITPTPKKYVELCDAAIPYITADCEWSAACGFISWENVPECVDWYAAFTVGIRGCHAELQHPDSVYDACIDAFKTFPCEENTIPAECEGIW